MAYPEGRDIIPNFLHADLTNRLADEAAKTASRIQNICMLLLAGEAVFGISTQPCRELCRLTEGNEMSARHLVSRDTKTLARHPSLEVGWKKTVISADKSADWHGRPCFECAP